jgi:beta-glucosidase
MGLYIWSLVDGFETIFGLSLRFGIIHVDEAFDRHPRRSALWFKRMLTASDDMTKPDSTTAASA